MTEQQYETAHWYTLYTKSRHEKLVEQVLSQRGIEAYTPKLKLKKQWSDRIKEVEEPLFKGYCFARFALKDKKIVLSQPGVAGIINFSGNYPHLKESVIESLKITTDRELRIDPFPYLNNGDLVTIKKGPLKGLSGYIIEKRKNNTVLVVSVVSIASSIRCTIDADFVDLM